MPCPRSRLFIITASSLLGLVLSIPAGAASLFTWTLPWADASDNALSMAGLNNAGWAGALGHVTVDANGHLQAGGQRIRFWGANLVGGGPFPAYGDAEKLAGRLAKFGFNIVRMHHMDNGWGVSSLWQDYGLDRQLDPVKLDRLGYLVQQLKQQGIYSNINLVVSRPFNPGSELDPSIAGIDDVKVRAALGFFDPAQQQLQRDYARDLLTFVNPYSGLSFAQDPAVAFVEVNNENGLVQAWLNGQLDGLPSYYRGLLNAKWDQWLALKYGSEPLLESAWAVSNTPLGSELLANGSFATVTGPWNFQLSGTPAATGSCTVQPDGAGATNVARLVISSPGQAGWHVQLFQGPLAVTAGAPYTLGFWAKASAPRSMNVTLMRDYGDYGSAGFSADPALTSAWQYFEYVFTPNSTDTDVRLNFGNLGLTTGTVWLGNVTLRPGGVLGLYPGEALGGGGIRNFLRSGETVGRTQEARRDWLRFLLQTEEAYWLGLRDYLKGSLGVQALIMGTVQGCSTPNLQANFDAIDSHYYWKHPSFPGTPWDPIDWYVENKAMPDDPAASAPASIGVQAVYGKPQSVTELNAPYPSSFEADIMLITAAYGGLGDWDAIYPFAHWSDEGGYGSANLQDYFTIGYNPVKMAAMPAAAAAFRRGDFSPSAGMVAVPMSRSDEVEQLLTASAWSMVNAGTAGEDRRAPLVRRVRQLIEGQSAPPGALAPGSSGPYGADIAAEGGQLHWLTGGVGGLVTGDSPRSQFAAGFLQGRSVALGAMTLSAVSSLQAGDYAVISLSSHDGLPLTATADALLTVLGTQRNTGSTYYQYPGTPISFPAAKGLNVTLRDQRGTGPVQVEGVSATVTLAFAPADVQVYALQPDGSRGAALPIVDAGGQAQVQLGPAYQTLIYEVAVDRPGYSPTPSRTVTPVQSPSATRTITVTPSQTPVPDSVVWEDMETGAAPAAWQAFADTSSGSILGVGRVTGTAAADGGFSHEVRFNSGGAGNWGGGFMVNSSYGTKPSLGWRDLQGMQVLQLLLWTDQPGLRVRATLSEAGDTSTAVNGADGERWESANGAWTLLPAGAWTLLSFPLAGFRDKPGYPYNPTSLGDNSLDLGAINWVILEWDGNQGAAVTLRVDDVRFLKDLPTATPSPSATPTRSPSPSPTLSPTASPWLSATVSPSATPSLSPGPSVTVSPTRSATPSASPSPSPSATASPVAPSATLTPASDNGGALNVLQQRFMPQPLTQVSGRLYFELENGAADLDWKVYSAAGVLLKETPLPGPFGPGWSWARVTVPDLPNGLFFSVLTARRGAERSSPKKSSFYLLR